MLRGLLLAAAVLGAVAVCPVPDAFPQSVAVRRDIWSFFSVLKYNAFYYTPTQGFCRGGDSWHGQPDMNGPMGRVKSAHNNDLGKGLWFCLETPHTDIGCMAECETRGDCKAFDRPDLAGEQECCLFTHSNIGDEQGGRKCFVKTASLKRTHPELANAPAGEKYMQAENWPVPFMSQLKLRTASAGDTGSAWAGPFCLPFMYCDFNIYDCEGELLYSVKSKWMNDLDAQTWLENPERSVLSYEIRGVDDKYLGRTTELQFGWKPIHLIDDQGTQAAIFITKWSLSMFFYPWTWYVDSEFPYQNPASYPLSDPRLLSYLAAYQFRNIGWLGPFWGFVFWALVVVFLARRFIMRRRSEYYDNLLEMEEHDRKVTGGCCTRRLKSAKTVEEEKRTWYATVFES